MTAWVGEIARVNAPAKVNLRLSITGRRSDGYHLLDSLVVPVSLFDGLAVRITPSRASSISLHVDPPAAAPPGAENLAVRAAELFLRRSGISAAVSIGLSKRIPLGAGLGGGSSDAAAVLRGLNALRQQPVPAPELMTWGLELGADVPLFVFGRPAHMCGIGEILTPWSGAIACPLVIAFPGVGVDTRTVYAKYDDLLTMSGPPSTIRPLTPGQEPLRSMLHNDLEAAAFHVQPALRSLRKRLCALGADGTSMTGSGSAIFGYWKHWDDARVAAEQLQRAGVWARVVRALERVPAVERVVA